MSLIIIECGQWTYLKEFPEKLTIVHIYNPEFQSLDIFLSS